MELSSDTLVKEEVGMEAVLMEVVSMGVGLMAVVGAVEPMVVGRECCFMHEISSSCCG